ncbi:MAG: sugar kinase [Thermoleophilia bacterium]|nr:sugar kinase [Thermoleophilia bacterium]
MRGLGAIGEGLLELGFPDTGDPAAPPAVGFGGDAANVCVMAARLGVPARLLGRVGDDGPGRRLLEFWRAAGVELDQVATDPGAPTGLYLNEPGPDGGHRFVYHRRGSAGSRLEPGDVRDGFLAGLGVLVVTGVTLAVSASSASTARAAVRRARAAGVDVACVVNHRPALGGDPRALAALAAAADVVVASREDMESLFGAGDEESVRARLPRVRELVLTDGGAPATVRSSAGSGAVHVPRAEVVNAAGAGDALAGAYLASRLTGRRPLEALAWGVAASALSVRAAGCAASYPSAASVGALVADLTATDVTG